MLIKDIAVYFKNGIITSLAKTVRMDIPEEMKTYIEHEHLYHITYCKETAQAIVASEHLRPAKGIGKNINSYGKACVCMFAGKPTIDNYIKNIADAMPNMNPYLNPTVIANAVEMDVKKEELNNYQLRGFADNSVLCEGYCIVPAERTKAVQLVADLIRDKDGKPTLDRNTRKTVRNSI